MTTDATQALSEALEGHIGLMRDLIEVTQQEYAQIIAFEHRELSVATEHKLSLLAQLEANEVAIGELLRVSATQLEMEMENPTATQVASALTGTTREQITSQVTRLRALTESFRELQAVCQLHAQRGLTVVRSYSALLRGHDPDRFQGTDSYTSMGRVRRESLPSKTVSRNA
jgi:flagellar biosynthesis/type III secretory pathway chaperone